MGVGAVWQPKICDNAVALQNPPAGSALFGVDLIGGAFIKTGGAAAPATDGAVSYVAISTEQIQDLVGAFFNDSSSIDVSYDDVGNALTANAVLKVQAQVVATNKVYGPADIDKWWSRSNGAVGMGDTMPAITAALDGHWLAVANDDTAASITFTAAAGQFFVGAGGAPGATTFVQSYAKRTMFVGVWNGGVNPFWRIWVNNNNVPTQKSGSSAVPGNLIAYASDSTTTGNRMADSGFAASSFQPADSDLSAIAALATTAFGRAFLTLADAVTSRAYLALGTVATLNTGTGAGDVPTITIGDARYQPVDSDLTAIAALATTAFGRSLLTLANTAALTTNIDLATTALKGAQAPADKARQDNNAKARVNAADFGADPTNATSSAAALTLAQAALPNGGIIEFNPGTYNFGNVNYNLSTAHITVQGTARYGTVFTTTNTAAPIITRNQYYQTIQDVTFTGTGSGQNPTGVAGQTLLSCNAANSAYGVVRRVSFTYGYIMCDISDTLSIVDDVECRFFKLSGVLVSQNSDHKIEDATMDNNTSFLPTGGGIDVKLTASLLINSCNIIHANNAIWLNAAGGVTIPSVKGVNNFFDNSAAGLMIDGAGSVLRSEFTNSWFSSMSVAGVSLTPAVGGQVDGITFVNCDIYNNVAGATTGIQTNAQTKKWKAIGCSVAGWTTGINLVAGAAHFPTITANTIGSVSAFGVNTTGIAIGAGAYGGLIIQNNDVIDNTTAATFGAVTITSAVYTRYRITDNAGINPKGAVTTPAVAATGVAVTNQTGFRVIIAYKTTGTISTAFAINGVATAPNLQPINSLSYLTLEPGGTVTWTGGTAPTWTWVGQ